MTKKSILAWALFLLSTVTFAQSADEKISRLINQFNYFELNRQYPLLKNEMKSELLQTVAEAFIGHYFNSPQQACAAYEKLFSEYKEELGCNTLFLSTLWADDLVSLGRTKEAKKLLQGIIQASEPGSEVRALFQSKHDLILSKEKLPKAELIRPAEDSRIPFYMVDIHVKSDSVGGFRMMGIPVTLNGKELSFMFDTGSDLSVISRQMAKDCRLKVICELQDGCQLGVAESLKIGDIVYKNAAFLIRPDSPGSQIAQPGVLLLGGQFLSDIGEFQIDNKRQQIIFPAEETELPYTKSNLMKDKHHYMEASLGGEKCVFLFDTGHSNSRLNHNYFCLHKEKVEAKGAPSQIAFVNQEGKTHQSAVYSLSNFPIEVANTNLVLKDIEVETNPEYDAKQNVSGVLGLDMFSLADKVTVNYNKLFIKIE